MTVMTVHVPPPPQWKTASSFERILGTYCGFHGLIGRIFLTILWTLVRFKPLTREALRIDVFGLFVKICETISIFSSVPAIGLQPGFFLSMTARLSSLISYDIFLFLSLMTPFPLLHNVLLVKGGDLDNPSR